MRTIASLLCRCFPQFQQREVNNHEDGYELFGTGSDEIPQAGSAADRQLQTTQMFQALKQKDKATVQKMLLAGAYIDSRDANDDTPLMWAAYNGWLDVAKDLLAKSSPNTINAVNTEGNTALTYACSKLRNIPFLTQLLERSSHETINTIDKCGNSALLFACITLSNIPFLTRLLECSSHETINTVDILGNSVLLLACDNLRNIPFLTQLLERSTHTAINTVNHLGNSAFLRACAKLTDIPFLTRLLEHSSPEAINTVNTQGTALLFLVYNPDNYQTAQHLLPLLLPRLTLKNLQSACTIKAMITAKTAWQLAHERGPGPWADIASRIGEAMLMECAQRQIPWGKQHYKSTTQQKQLTQGTQTSANICEEILKPKKIPVDILDIIRNYNESPFSSPQEALDAINDFLKQHLQQKEQYKKDGSQLFRSVDDVLLALNDSKSELSASLAEYASIKTL